MSEDERVSVLLIERGGLEDGWISRIPLFSSHFLSDGSRTRLWKSVPQRHANGRSFELAGGNSLGGSSKINAMLYTRGIPAEYNSWSKAGRKGWSYNQVQPYFIKSETDLDEAPNNTKDFHGTSGEFLMPSVCSCMFIVTCLGEWQNRSHKQSFWGHTP